MLIKAYQKKKNNYQNFNCAEKVINLSNDVLNLELSESACRLAGGFGGGLGIGHLCGAIAGAIMVLSLKNIDTIAHESNIKDLERKLLRDIRGSLGSLMCKDLKASYYNPTDKCEFIIETVLTILDQYCQTESDVMKTD
jgi:C_GCAxxG_C_C family probable redox protein